MSEKIIIIGANHAAPPPIKFSRSIPTPTSRSFDHNSNISFLGCGMALWIGNQITHGDGLFYSSKEALEKAGAKVRMETEITSVDYDKKEVHFKDKDGNRRQCLRQADPSDGLV